MTILALDDERNALKSLELALREAAPEADIHAFQWPEDALRFADAHMVHIAFLDIETGSVMLPPSAPPDAEQEAGPGGLIVARRLIARNPRCNIIFTTGYDEYRGEALDMYASGYVKKPVRAERIAKELQNLRHPLREEVLPALGPYRIDRRAQRVYLDGRDTLLKPKEFHLFCVLAEHPGVFFSPEELFARVWGENPNHNVRTVYTHISRLRGKLGMTEESAYDIEAKRNMGYRLLTPETV